MRTRIVTALAGAPLLIAAILWPGGEGSLYGWPAWLLTILVLAQGLREFYGAARSAGYFPQELVGLMASILWLRMFQPMRDPQAAWGIGLLFTILVMASLSVEALRKERAPLRNLGVTWLGAVYIGWLAPFLLGLRLAETPWPLPSSWMEGCGRGAWLLLFTVVLTSAIDSGAYFVGRSIGKRKLAPEVSPGKTWEGAIGGFVAGIVAGLAAGTLLGLPPGFALTAAALAGVLSQLGDLSKSAMKREIGIKDFGGLLPGHGGVLDRFDSLLFAAPAVYWLLQVWPR